MMRYSKLLDNYKSELPKIDQDWPPKVQQVTNCIHKNLFEQKLAISWVKEQCEIVENYFSSKYLIYTGFLPKQYILHHRIKVSKKLLKANGSTITLIALSTGFSSSSSFCHVFKSRLDKSPSQWRNK